MTCTSSVISLNIWSPVPGTTVKSSGSTLTISADGTSDYDTIVGMGLGFAPMYIGSIQGSFCASTNISLVINRYKSNANVYAGFMLLTNNLTPMFEFAIGGSNKGSLAPITTPFSTLCTFNGYKPLSGVNSLSISGNGTQIQVAGQNVNLTQAPAYLAMYLRGSGNNTASFTNLAFNGLQSFTWPSSPVYDLQIPSTEYYGQTVYNYGVVSSVEQCKSICNSDVTASGFTYDHETGLCKIIQDLEITNFKAAKTSNTYIKTLPVLSDVHVSVGNGQIQSTSVNGLNISIIAIDNQGRFNDALVITDNGVFVSNTFVFAPIATGDAPSTAVLTIKLNINNSSVYIYSLNNYDFKRIGIIDANFNKVSGKFVNQHFKFDVNQGGNWYVSDSHSYTNLQQIQTFNDFYFSYNGGTDKQFQFVKGIDKSAPNIKLKYYSPCKIIATAGDRIMCISQNILVMLTGTESYWSNDLITGCLLFRSDIYNVQSTSTTIIRGGSPNLPSHPSFITSTNCNALTCADLDVRYNVTYRNFLNNDTLILQKDGNFTFNGTGFKFTPGTFNLTTGLAGYDCIAQISLVSKPTTVNAMYANSADERQTDDDFGEYPIFVTYNSIPITIEFTPTPTPINYILP
jgi:hypothetical protein